VDGRRVEPKNNLRQSEHTHTHTHTSLHNITNEIKICSMYMVSIEHVISIVTRASGSVSTSLAREKPYSCVNTRTWLSVPRKITG